MHGLFNSPSDARSIAHPWIVEAVDSRFEGAKLLFDAVSVSVVDPTAQSYSEEGSPIAESISEKLGLGESVSLVDFPQKRGRQNSAMSTEQRDTKGYL